VFFDGEEAYDHSDESDVRELYFARIQGSSAKQSRRILFDMVGDRSLDVTLPADCLPK